MRRIIQTSRAAVVAAGLVLACSAKASAIPIPVGTTIADDLLINFDFSSATPAPPYFDVIAFFVATLTAGESVVMDTFDGLDGTSFVTASTFFGPLTSFGQNCTCPELTDGQFSFGLRMITGSADLTSFEATARSAAGVPVTISGTVATPVPEPATFALLGLGLAGLAASRRKR